MAYLLSITILSSILIGFTNSASWRSKEHQYNYRMSVIENGVTNKWMKGFQPCKDEVKACKKWKDNGQLNCNLKIIKKFCKDSCDVCRAEGPPLDCKVSKHGCCWDNSTAATGKFQQGCPACKDRYPDECKAFLKQCGREDIRIMCPQTCGVPCKTCEDDRHQHTICPLYKEHGFCTHSPILMKKVCSRTCGFCPS